MQELKRQMTDNHTLAHKVLSMSAHLVGALSLSWLALCRMIRAGLLSVIVVYAMQECKESDKVAIEFFERRLLSSLSSSILEPRPLALVLMSHRSLTDSHEAS
jgi:hypothetical protein